MGGGMPDMGGAPLPPEDPSQMMPPPPPPPAPGADPNGAPDIPPPPNGNMGQPQGDGNDELTQVIDGLSMEDKAAVLKYAKSMNGNDADGNQEGQLPPQGPMESRERLATLEETIRSIASELKDRNPKRKDAKADSKVPKSNPFKDKWQ